MKKITSSCSDQDKFSKAQALEMDLKSKVKISTGGGNKVERQISKAEKRE